MNEVILSGLGILLALCGMTVLIFRRVSPIIVGPLAALLVTVMSGLPVLDSVTGTYVQGVGSFFVSYFMIFLLGNILGSLYQISGAAAKIGETVVRWFGAKNCMVACLISAALLSYGGINSFVIIFAIYPIALKLFEEADLPTYLLPGIVCGGMWTFAMTGPFSPQICNIVSMQSLGTPSYAGLIPGLAASVVMAVLIVWYMNRQAKKAKGRGEHFTPPEGGVRQHEGPTPGTVVSFIPLTAVIVLLFSRSILCRDMPSASKRLTIFSGRMHLILILTYPRVNFHKNIYLSAAPISFYFSLQNDVFESVPVPAGNCILHHFSYSTAAISPVHTTVCLSAQQILSSVPAMLSIPSAVCSRTFESENSSTPQ